MNLRYINHVDYEFSVFFAVPLSFRDGSQTIEGKLWFDEPAIPYELRARECRFDELSDYGFIIEPSSDKVEREAAAGRTRGLLLCDALANIDGFVEVLSELPADWNFGGLVAIDRMSRVAFNTNCDVAETPEWRRILTSFASQDVVEATFSQTDVGVRLERREGDVIIQQFAWEVPDDWGPRGSDRYPRHRFSDGERCQQKLLHVLNSYDQLREKLRIHGAPSHVISRLGPANECT